MSAITAQETLRQQIVQQVDQFLANGGQIIQADSSFNVDADTRFYDTNRGLRYVDKDLASKRQNTHNKVKRVRK